ncbi:MAG: hypothetical protein KTR32_06560 [Granulosicoccus sp.]|nr:hypothetical protein [Granulosicoccus sp.]
MSVRLHRRYRGAVTAGSDPFTDLLFNILLGFILLFFLAILFINPAEKTGKIDIDAQFIITVSWPDNSPDDIDTWVQDPNGNIVWFRNRSSNLVHLDRDDRGMLNDVLEVNGQQFDNPLNQEIAAIRGVVPGEYIVNVHYYESETSEPVPVSVKVSKVNPVYTVAYYGVTTLQSKGEEKTAVRFTVATDGSVVNLNQLPARLVPR